MLVCGALYKFTDSVFRTHPSPVILMREGERTVVIADAKTGETMELRRDFFQQHFEQLEPRSP